MPELSSIQTFLSFLLLSFGDVFLVQSDEQWSAKLSATSFGDGKKLTEFLPGIALKAFRDV
jgi:hypothetical protein